MSERTPLRGTIATGLVALVGLAGTAVALGSRGAEEEFLHEQRNPPKLRPADVELVVQSAPDPQVGSGAGIRADCDAGSDSSFGNPWSCAVTYKSGRRVRIRVRVLRDGTYTGRYEGGGGASGCCIDLPGTR